MKLIKSPIVRKVKEERIIFEAIYDFFNDDTIKDEMVTISRIYHDGDDFQTIVIVEPYKFIFVVTYDAESDKTSVKAYRSVGGLNND